MITFTHTIADKLGLHARPAGLLAKEAAKFTSKITLSTPNAKADPKKIITLLSLGAACGEELTFTFEGDDEQAAKEAIEAFCKANL